MSELTDKVDRASRQLTEMATGIAKSMEVPAAAIVLLTPGDSMIFMGVHQGIPDEQMLDVMDRVADGIQKAAHHLRTGECDSVTDDGEVTHVRMHYPKPNDDETSLPA